MKTETMEAEEKNHLTYSFHPYFGYMPTLVKAKDGEETEELLYKLDPMYGFVPAKKDDESTEETDAKRKKREAGKITREKERTEKRGKKQENLNVPKKQMIGLKEVRNIFYHKTSF